MGGANWVTRRLAARDPLAEPAMTATASYVLLKALAHEAGRSASGGLRRRPLAPGADARAAAGRASGLGRWPDGWRPPPVRAGPRWPW